MRLGTTEVLEHLVSTELGTHIHVRDEGDDMFSVLVKRDTYEWQNISSEMPVGGRQLALAIVRYNAEWVLT